MLLRLLEHFAVFAHAHPVRFWLRACIAMLSAHAAVFFAAKHGVVAPTGGSSFPLVPTLSAQLALLGTTVATLWVAAAQGPKGRNGSAVFLPHFTLTGLKPLVASGVALCVYLAGCVLVGELGLPALRYASLIAPVWLALNVLHWAGFLVRTADLFTAQGQQSVLHGYYQRICSREQEEVSKTLQILEQTVREFDGRVRVGHGANQAGRGASLMLEANAHPRYLAKVRPRLIRAACLFVRGASESHPIELYFPKFRDVAPRQTPAICSFPSALKRDRLAQFLIRKAVRYESSQAQMNVELAVDAAHEEAMLSALKLGGVNYFEDALLSALSWNSQLHERMHEASAAPLVKTLRTVAKAVSDMNASARAPYVSTLFQRLCQEACQAEQRTAALLFATLACYEVLAKTGSIAESETLAMEWEWVWRSCSEHADKKIQSGAHTVTLRILWNMCQAQHTDVAYGFLENVGWPCEGESEELQSFRLAAWELMWRTSPEWVHYFNASWLPSLRAPFLWKELLRQHASDETGEASVWGTLADLRRAELTSRAARYHPRSIDSPSELLLFLCAVTVRDLGEEDRVNLNEWVRDHSSALFGHDVGIPSVPSIGAFVQRWKPCSNLLPQFLPAELLGPRVGMTADLLTSLRVTHSKSLDAQSRYSRYAFCSEVGTHEELLKAALEEELRELNAR